MDQTSNHYDVCDSVLIIPYEKKLDVWELLLQATKNLEKINCEHLNWMVNGYQVNIAKELGE